MSKLNWRCCAKLNRFKKSVEILFRMKNDPKHYNTGTYRDDSEDITYYDINGIETIYKPEFKDYEFVTLGEP